jgi:hypothetical protein
MHPSRARFVVISRTQLLRQPIAWRGKILWRPLNVLMRADGVRWTLGTGAETETTLRANIAAFAAVTLWPRCLVDVSHVSSRCDVPTLGLVGLAAPLMVSPVVGHGEGEITYPQPKSHES